MASEALELHESAADAGDAVRVEQLPAGLSHLLPQILFQGVILEARCFFALESCKLHLLLVFYGCPFSTPGGPSRFGFEAMPVVVASFRFLDAKNLELVLIP